MVFHEIIRAFEFRIDPLIDQLSFKAMKKQKLPFYLTHSRGEDRIHAFSEIWTGIGTRLSDSTFLFT